ncbi:uncharacterized protein F4812DRAFT_269058 [Daldinia caldariorum]|uniref:uncharacterized protein n=1 Tax=Daldinia caldariorum TaxID=326644 RepID=UPI0020089A61|nr:uncharacterized protein F4812DRAFT_269058 [Daldinia caldariorum]KAI1470534.1 hypothetical protein F4812DRAFT_269058 [Daldinia caldariorum]
MGHPPAYIFIVRHGKRLDAADKQWHLSSPTPYDPPLTYGGWLQSKTVGARIAHILQEREAEDEATVASNESNNSLTKPKKRRYKVVIHSSPFLRCVQTSIAIAAGLASTPALPTPIERSPSPRSTHVSPLSSPAIRPNTSTPPLAKSSHSPSKARLVERSVLRLDAFLGEWLSPDYFEHITPPPRSSLMLATAKAEILRQENHNDYAQFHTRHVPSTSSQLWNAAPSRGSPLATSVTPESDTNPGLDSLSSLKSHLPRYRSESVGQIDPRTAHKVSLPNPTLNQGYVGPVPSYALSTSEPIPRGYVTHARDACVDFDYQWDSSRDDIGWGDGGILPEEWAEMHQRFRKGLKRLVEWYSTTKNPAEMVTKSSSPASPKFPPNKSDNSSRSIDDEVEVESVVVLVSHGAGCNALIGAITQQPVLIDVGMSSITMAERKPEFDSALATTSIYGGQASSLEKPLSAKQPSLSDMFELRLFANTEHLSTITPAGLSRSLSAASRNGRGRNSNGFTSVLKEVAFGNSLYGNQASLSRSNSINASLGSMRRGSPVPTSSSPKMAAAVGVTISNGTSSASSTQADRSSSPGLWTPPTPDNALPEEQTETSPITKNGHQSEATKHNGETSTEIQEGYSQPNGTGSFVAKKTISKTRSESSHGEGHDQFDENPAPRLWGGASNGLWGTPQPPGEAERIRDFTSTKRRWTVNER